MFDLGNLLGSAVRTVGSWLRPTGWQNQDHQAVQAAQVRLTRDLNRVQTDGVALLTTTAERVQEISSSAAILGAGCRALQSAARESGNPLLRQSVADLVLCATVRPVDQAAANRHMQRVNDCLRQARPFLDRPAFLAALRALHDIRRSLEIGAVEIPTAARKVVQSAVGTAATTADLARAWANQAADHLINLGGGTLAGLAGGAAIGAILGATAGPVGALAGLTVGALTGTVTGLLAGVTFGPNWRLMG